MGITRKRFEKALAVLRDSYRVSIDGVGKATFIHLRPQYIPVAQVDANAF